MKDENRQGNRWLSFGKHLADVSCVCLDIFCLGMTQYQRTCFTHSMNLCQALRLTINKKNILLASLNHGIKDFQSVTEHIEHWQNHGNWWYRIDHSNIKVSSGGHLLWGREAMNLRYRTTPLFLDFPYEMTPLFHHEMMSLFRDPPKRWCLFHELLNLRFNMSTIVLWYIPGCILLDIYL